MKTVVAVSPHGELHKLTMPKPLSDDTILFLRFAPYFALLEGRDANQTTEFNDKYDAQPEVVREFLLSPASADLIVALMKSGVLPDSHGTAVAKLLGMLAMGDVTEDQVGPLLLKLGIPQSSAAVISEHFTAILKPVVAGRIAQIAQQKLRQIQPLTQRIGSPLPPPPINAPESASRNIIDLREQERTS